MEIIEKMELALKKGEFKEFLEGKNEYRIAEREGRLSSDYNMALVFGVYEYYKRNPESKINIRFENEIFKMLQGDYYEIMCAFEHCWNQLYNEERNVAPFRISDQCINNVGKTVYSKKEELSHYKEFCSVSEHTENGAYEWALSLNSVLDERGRKIL